MCIRDSLFTVEKLKGVERHTRVLQGSRQENSAEHSWHATIASYLLREFEPEGLDRAKASLMLLVHELVEIEAGDHNVWDADKLDQIAKEKAAAKSPLLTQIWSQNRCLCSTTLTGNIG